MHSLSTNIIALVDNGDIDNQSIHHQNTSMEDEEDHGSLERELGLLTGTESNYNIRSNSMEQLIEDEQSPHIIEEIPMNDDDDDHEDDDDFEKPSERATAGKKVKFVEDEIIIDDAKESKDAYNEEVRTLSGSSYDDNKTVINYADDDNEEHAEVDVDHSSEPPVCKKKRVCGTLSSVKQETTVDDVERLERIHMAFQSAIEPVAVTPPQPPPTNVPGNETTATEVITKILKEKYSTSNEEFTLTTAKPSKVPATQKRVQTRRSKSRSKATPKKIVSLNNSSSRSEIDLTNNASNLVPLPIKTEEIDPPHDEAYQKRKHTCQVCGKKFVGKSNLVDHLRYHANVKLFKCHYCGKQFVQSGTLKCHLRTHTQEKPYKCTYCTKTFTQASARNVHIKTHTNERNHVCEFCFKGFITSGDLTKHKRTHEAVKKFICEVCMHGFSQKVNYVKHKFLVHGIKGTTAKPSDVMPMPRDG